MTSLNLFDDLIDDGGITHSSSSKDVAAKAINRLWKLWCLRTEREDVKTANKDFASAVREAIRNGVPESDLERIIEGAARTEPRTRDPHDIRRLTTAITNPKIRKFALSALDEDLEIQTNPAHRQKITVGAVENILETNRNDWGAEDIDSAILLTERYEEQELIEIADKVALIVGQDALFPSEVVRNLRKIETGKYKIKKNDRRSSYGAGAEESARDEDINFYADKAADDAFNRGISASVLLAFHLQAPEGYWAEVSVLRRASKTPIDAIYSSLEERFGWHPSMREPIAKGKR